MKSIGMFGFLALVAVIVASTLAANPVEYPRVKYLGDEPEQAPRNDYAKAGRDTVYLMGGDGDWTGRFETPEGDPDWHGWTIGDDGGLSSPLWHADTYNAENLGGEGNHAAWCGADFPSCGGEDPDGGYGNDWYEILNFWALAPATDQPTTVTVNYDANFDTEPGWDFVELKYEKDDGNYETVFAIDGDFQGMFGQSVEFAILPADYVGDDDDQIHLQWRVTSDGNTSDEDCYYPSNGACQIDNLQVLFNGNEVSFDDFEDGPYPDGVLGNWIVSYPPAEDGHAELGRDLPEEDPDQDNTSWQVNWLAYGEVGDSDFYFHERIVSPPLALSEGGDQIIYASDICVNSTWNDSMGFVGFGFSLRSTAEADSAALAHAEWRNDGFLHTGSIGYHRSEQDMGEYLVPEARWLQVAFWVYDPGWAWGMAPATGEAAPYFDNVAVKAVNTSTSVPIPDATDLWVTAYPNPFNPQTTISFSLERNERASVAVYELTGKRVMALADRRFVAGTHWLTWNGRDAQGRALPSGTYLVRLETESAVRAQKLMLIR